MTTRSTGARRGHSAIRRVSGRLDGPSDPVQRRRQQPRFDWLENRRLLSVGINEYPIQSFGGTTEGIAASSTAIWVTEDTGNLASINPASGAVAQYSIPTPDSGPTAITPGPDGNSMWFLETTANQIGVINLTTDAITEYPLLDTPKAGLSDITAGPPDELWFTESTANRIGVINTQTGAISDFPLPGTNAMPEAITYGPDGNLWIADENENQIVSFNPVTLVSTAHTIGATSQNHTDYVAGITVGPDQNIWFTEPPTGSIGMFNLTTQEFGKSVSLGTGEETTAIITGPDGNLWVANDYYDYGSLQVYSPSTGTVSSYMNDNDPFAKLSAICAGPGTSKGIWASDHYGDNTDVYSFTTAGAETIISTSTPTDGSDVPTSIVSDQNGNLWYIEPWSNQIGVFDPATDSSTSISFDAGSAVPNQLILDPVTGSLWLFAQVDSETRTEVDEINPSTYAITRVGDLPRTGAYVGAATFDASDGDIWFLDGNDADFLGSVDPTTGVITENVSLSADPAQPFNIVADANGNLWFADTYYQAMTEYIPGTSQLNQTSAYVGYVSDMILGPDNRLWLSVGAYSFDVLEFNPVSENVSEAFDADVGPIALGPDNAIWFGSGNGVGSGDITTGDVTYYDTSLSVGEGSITAGEDGNMWFTGLASSGSPAYIGCIGLTAATQPSSLSIATQPGNVSAGDGFGLVVDVENAAGTLNTFYQGSVTISLSTDPSGDAKLGGTLTATAVNGVAVFAGLTLNKAGTGYVIQAAATGLTSTTTEPFNVALAATHLVITTGPPNSVGAGTEFTTVVSAEDASGNIDVSYDQPITLTLLNNTEDATLGGTVTQGALEGIATFTDLTVNEIGDGYALQAASGTFATVQSSSFDVTAPPATNLVIASGPPSTLVAGTPFDLVVDADNSQDSIATQYSGLVTLTLAGGPSQAALIGTLQMSASAGIATFSGLSLDLTAGNYTITITAVGLPPIATAAITVTPAAPYQLVVTQEPTTSVSAGTPFPVQPVVEEEDQFGNLEIDDDSTTLTVSLVSATGGLTGSSVVVSGGVATFATLAADLVGTFELEYSAGGITLIDPTQITVGIGAAYQLVLATGYSTTATAGVALAHGPVVLEEDQFGNVETADNDTIVNVTLASGPGKLVGTRSVIVVDGVATFSDLLDQTAGTITLVFTSGTLESATSTAIVISASPTEAKLGAGGTIATTQTAGSVFNPAPVIDIEDRYGNVETTDETTQVTVTLTSGNGTLEGTTTVTVVNGVATFADLYIDVSGSITLTFTAEGLTSVTTVITIVPAPTSSSSVLELIGSPPLSVTAGQVISPAPVVEIFDQYGNLETTDSTTQITVILMAGGGKLEGTTTVSVVDGVATFSDIYIDISGSITLSFETGSLAAVTTVITINPVPVGSSSVLDLIGSLPLTVTAGQILTPAPVIEIFDQYGNLETADNSTQITVVIETGSGTLRGTTTVTVVNGVATFNDVYDTVSGTITLSFESGTLAPVTTVITIDPVPTNASSTLEWMGSLPMTVSAGEIFTPAPVIEILDQYGNLETTDNTTRITVVIASGGGTIEGTTTVTVVGGVATFADIFIDVAGSVTLSFSTASLAAVNSPAITVSPGAAAQLVIETEPSPSAVAGQILQRQPVVAVEDAYGNLETADSSTVVTVQIAGGGSLQGTVTVTVTDGVAAFRDLAADQAQTITLVLSSGSLAAASTSAVTIAAGPMTQLVLTTTPSSPTAGQPFTAVVSAEDAYGNLASSYSGDVTITLPGQSTPATTQASNGVATFTGLVVTSPAATATIQVSGSGLGTVTSQPLVITAPIQTVVVPLVTSETVLDAPTKSKKGKHSGKPVISGFTLTFDTPLDAASASNAASYEVDYTITRRVKRKTVTRLNPVPITAAYNPATNSVVLKIQGNQPFTKGGEITVISTPSTGVQSQGGAPLSPGDTTFLILPKAAGVQPQT